MIKSIAVIGAGTMGHGIAVSFASYGYSVCLYDSNAKVRDAVQNAMRADLYFLQENDALPCKSVDDALSRITICGALEKAAREADYVIESVSENLALKRELFQNLDALCKPHCIFASNTSSLQLGEMMEGLSPARQACMMVCHWYNPPHIMPIVELSCFGNMSCERYQVIADLYHSIGKQSVKVLKDVPGLVANRIQQGLAREVFSIIEQGIAEPSDVDKALMYGPAFRYATTGQLEVADMGGLDIWCITGDNLLAVMDSRNCANPLLRQKVEEGKLGLKTGEGFYSYPEERLSKIREDFYKRLLIQLKTSKQYMK